MHKKKIKIFLGGFMNYTNAQNLNCKAIAENLNKNKFEVYALRIHFGNNEVFSCNTFFCAQPFRMTRHLGFLWGIMKADVLYLPKVDTPSWVLKLSKLLNKPMFTTIEENVTDLSKRNLIESGRFRSEQEMRSYFVNFSAVFGITQYIINNTHNVLRIREAPLVLGVNLKNFSYYNKESLCSLIFVGSLIKRKRVEEFIKLAKEFPMLNFKIVGDGSEKERLMQLASENVRFLGGLDHSEVNEIFKKSDVMFLPSKSEGFPKVILEAAAAGIPSIVYSDYGASEWIVNKENGFVVNNFEQLTATIRTLIDDKNLLLKNSEGAILMAKKFDWKDVINNWEEVIIDLYDGK